MSESTEISFEQTRKDFLSFLKYTKGHSDTTCYNYNSDLSIWHRWLIKAKLDWFIPRRGRGACGSQKDFLPSHLL